MSRIPNDIFTADDAALSVLTDTLGFTNRTANALANSGITSLSELLKLTGPELAGIGGLGKKGHEEINNKLASFTPEQIQNILDKEGNKSQAQAAGEEAHPIYNSQTLVEDLGLSIRTTNALINNGIIKLGDLTGLTLANIKTLRGLGAAGIEELKQHVLPTDSPQRKENPVEFNEFVLTRLGATQIAVLDKYYGLTGESGTLEYVSKALGLNITRERVRQILKAGLRKIKAAVQSGYIDPSIGQTILSHINAPIHTLPELDSAYPKKAVVRIYADAKVSDIYIYKNRALKSQWAINNFIKMEHNVSVALKALKNQIGPVRINELSAEYNVPENIFYDLDKVTITDELIVLNTNKRAVGNDLAFEIKNFMDKMVRPVTLSEICAELGMSINQARGLVYRIPGVVNVGLSKYALEKYGYSSKNAAEIAAELLEAEGQPVHIDKITSYVTKYRLINTTSVSAALMAAPDIFTKLDDGYFALKTWGYEPTQDAKNSRLEVPAKHAVLDILSKSETPMSPAEILLAVKNKYGSKSTDKAVTISAVLVALHNAGVLDKFGTLRSPFYALKRGDNEARHTVS